MAGLKCPPDTDADVMMAKAIPARSALAIPIRRWRLTESKGESDIEQRAKHGSVWLGSFRGSSFDNCKELGGRSSDTRENVEEDAGGLSYHLPEPSRTLLFVIDPFERRRWGANDLALKVLLGGLCHTELHLAGSLPSQII